MGREGRVEHTRELIVPDTSYIVIYEVVGPINLHILAVVHGREQFPPERDRP